MEPDTTVTTESAIDRFNATYTQACVTVATMINVYVINVTAYHQLPTVVSNSLSLVTNDTGRLYNRAENDAPYAQNNRMIDNLVQFYALVLSDGLREGKKLVEDNPIMKQVTEDIFNEELLLWVRKLIYAYNANVEPEDRGTKNNVSIFKKQKATILNLVYELFQYFTSADIIENTIISYFNNK